MYYIYEAHTEIRLKEIIQPPPTNAATPSPDLTTSVEQKFSYGEIQKYTDI